MKPDYSNILDDQSLASSLVEELDNLLGGNGFVLIAFSSPDITGVLPTAVLSNRQRVVQKTVLEMAVKNIPDHIPNRMESRH